EDLEDIAIFSTFAVKASAINVTLSRKHSKNTSLQSLDSSISNVSSNQFWGSFSFCENSSSVLYEGRAG
uniref:Uncharacterized protein n=1 Tax=Ciona intestinalis TaxID=7719 RepID=H2XNH5_CIOIN